jgi:hypothetical protein
LIFGFRLFVISLIYDVGSAHPTFELLFMCDVDVVRRIVLFNEVKFPIGPAPRSTIVENAGHSLDTKTTGYLETSPNSPA